MAAQHTTHLELVKGSTDHYNVVCSICGIASRGAGYQYTLVEAHRHTDGWARLAAATKGGRR